MLFGRRIQTKLPYIFESNETDEQKKISDLHDQKKLISKNTTLIRSGWQSQRRLMQVTRS